MDWTIANYGYGTSFCQQPQDAKCKKKRIGWSKEKEKVIELYEYQLAENVIYR